MRARVEKVDVLGWNKSLCMYVYDINTILFRCLKTKTGNDRLDTFKDLHQLLITRGIQPQYVRIDNECPDVVKKYIKKDLQLTPPQMHRCN